MERKGERVTDNNYYIYALWCPLSEQVRYVGRTGDPVLRLQQHMEETPPSTPKKGAWLDSLREQGLEPELLVLQTLDFREDSREPEIEWMYRLLDEGHELVNHIPRRLSERLAEQERKRRALDQAIQRGHELFPTDTD